MIGERFLNKHLENLETLIKPHHKLLTAKMVKLRTMLNQKIFLEMQV